MRNKGLKLVSPIIGFFVFFVLMSNHVFADSDNQVVIGHIYEFEKDSKYEITENTSQHLTGDDNTYGRFAINADVVDISEYEDTLIYGVRNDSVEFYYTYSDKRLNENEDSASWYLADDSGKKVDGIKLDKKIGKGAVIIQSSKDRKSWHTDLTLTNVFEDIPVQTESIYSANSIQLSGGCYFRVTIAYKEYLRLDPQKILFIDIDKNEYKKNMEVYEFFLYDINSIENLEATTKYSLGKKEKVSSAGYTDSKEIKVDDPHYGWDLGNFFVSGFSSEKTMEDGKIVFLKNIGDEVKLYFNLNQNIDYLNGNESLSIERDKDGYDTYFETLKTDFGRGTLIVRKTDNENIVGEPVIYTNYLEASASTGADTVIQICEEGDYEVALDYVIKEDWIAGSIIPIKHYYRIFFTFSVRNGNCMVFPFELNTGKELTNKSFTASGFKIDLAKSLYLDIAVKKEVITKTANGWDTDIRFNRPAQDGEEYSEEGIYTITAQNNYTGQETVKTIYVGTDPIIMAHVVTGLSVEEVEEQVSSGAEINDDGTITILKQALPGQEKGQTVNNKRGNVLIIAGSVLVVIIVILVMVVASIKKNKQKKLQEKTDQGGDQE